MFPPKPRISFFRFNKRKKGKEIQKLKFLTMPWESAVSILDSERRKRGKRRRKRDLRRRKRDLRRRIS